MNWTEGSLARHSRGRHRNALLVRQKQHFAKARSSLLSGRAGHGPVEISFPASKSSSGSPHQAPLNRDRPSSPSMIGKHEARPEYPTSPIDGNHGATNLERRKRWLEKPDWAGLGLQKPLDISFPGQVYATRKWARVTRPRERTPKEYRKHAVARAGERYERGKRSSMRFRIGSQEVRPSIATGSQLSTKRSTLTPKQQIQMSRHDLTLENSQYAHYPKHQKYGNMNIASGDKSRASPAQLDGPETPVNVVYSSSAIHEPAPRRNNEFHVLQWSPSGSEDRGSMQVEIRPLDHPVPPLQEPEQQWTDWILDRTSNHPPSSALTVTNTTEIHSEQSRSSAPTLPSHLQPRLPSLHLSSEADMAPVSDWSECTGIEEISGSYGIPRGSRCPPRKHDLVPPKRQCTPIKKPNGHDDPNNIWMKFAFGVEDSSEELLIDAFKEAAHRAAMDLQPSNTSGNEDEDTKNTITCKSELSSPYHGTRDGATSSSESKMVMKGATGSESAFSNVATIGSTDEPSRSFTCFTIPKAFIGKHANTGKVSIARPVVAKIQSGGRKGMGKRGKWAADNRPNIRELPNFEGDPIEEIEDD